MSRGRFVVAAGVVGLIVLTAALALSSLASVDTATLEGFQRTADPRKIVVTVVVGLGDDIAERTVREEATAVTVTVRVRRDPAPKDLIGVVLPVLVSLKEPLGERAVLDHDGRPVRDLGDYRPPTPSR